MKYYSITWPLEDGTVGKETLSEDQIIAEYYHWWQIQMIRKYGQDSSLITRENCIEDWITTHYAFEVKGEIK